MRYLIQFPAGATPLVEHAVFADCSDVHIKYVDDSALVFDSTTRLRSADQMTYAKNVFVVQGETRRQALNKAVTALAKSATTIARSKHGQQHGFRVMFHIDGQLTPVDPKLRRTIEGALGKATGAHVVPRGGGREFWIIGRRESPMLYLAERLPQRNKPEPARGALSPELSAVLIAASEPHSDDVFLDPFAGSGALVAARLRSKVRRIIYNDQHLAQLKGRFPKTLIQSDYVKFHADNALLLPAIETGSVDVIVTDPPWGEHDDSIGDYSQFATLFAASAARVLRSDSGRAVVLINRRNEELLADALATASLKVRDSFQILVNGHPASVLCVHL